MRRGGRTTSRPHRRAFPGHLPGRAGRQRAVPPASGCGIAWPGAFSLARQIWSWTSRGTRIASLTDSTSVNVESKRPNHLFLVSA